MDLNKQRYIIIMITILFLFSEITFSQNNWSKWGKEDQIGTLNYITPEVITYASSLVKKGAVYSLALPLSSYQPSPNRRLQRFMTDTGQGSSSGRYPLWLEDWISLPCHGTTHWDGLGHVFGEGKIYNGYNAETYITPEGALKNGIHNARNKIVTRGVLIDLAQHKKLEYLPAGYVITPKDIMETARIQGVTFRQGDILLIRTGWINVFYKDDEDVFMKSEPGIGWELSQWLKNQKISAVALDNLNAEVNPCEGEAGKNIGYPDFKYPIHYELIRNQGMLVGELFRLDALAKDCAGDGVYEFLFIASPLNLTNATGSPINPIVIK